MLGCNLLFPLPEPAPTAEGSVTPITATPRRETPTRPLPTTAQTPIATLLRALVPTPRPRETATPTPPAPTTARVNAALVNLRGGPGTNYAIVGALRASEQLTVTGRNGAGDWLRVCCPVGQTEESWVSASLVDLQLPTGQSATSIPLATSLPPPEPVVRAASGGNPGGSGNGAGAGLPGPGGFGAVNGTNPFTGQGGGRSGQRPLIVCVNNDYAARPQLGLSQADIVYEYLMEGYGITRFSALFYGEESSQIGPVRSARLINYYMGRSMMLGWPAPAPAIRCAICSNTKPPFPTWISTWTILPMRATRSALAVTTARACARVRVACAVGWANGE